MKILIADDHELVRDALATLLERDDPDCEVLHADDFHSAFELVGQFEDIDIVLMDVYMPGMDSLNSLKVLLDNFPDTLVVLMSGHAQQVDISKGFDLGARGFVSKSMKGDGLRSVLNLVQSGMRYVPELMLDGNESGSELNSVVSKREKDVLGELSKGYTNKVIARNLSIEETTVKLHLRSIFKKLDATNRTEAVIKARQYKLIS